MLYSSKTNGFYVEAAPSDAVEVSDSTYQSMMEGQAAGQTIKPGADGSPVLTPQPASYDTWDADTESYTTNTAAKAEALSSVVRAERDRRIKDLEWRVQRHLSETRQGLAETSDVITTLDAKIQALRDLPTQDGFPWSGPDDEAVPWP